MQDGEVSLRLDSGLVVLIDPLALDGLKDLFTHEFAARLAADPSLVRTVPGFLRVGIHRMNPFAPGSHRVSRLAIEQVDDASSEEDDGIFDIDTGSVVLVDVHHLASVANALTWERYDWALQAPSDDTSRWAAIAREAGGDVFGILDAESDSPFPGDGRYRLRSDAFRRVLA
jgi:hypothetical protein